LLVELIVAGLTFLGDVSDFSSNSVFILELMTRPPRESKKIWKRLKTENLLLIF
jgi:hypothetical protein